MLLVVVERRCLMVIAPDYTTQICYTALFICSVCSRYASGFLTTLTPHAGVYRVKEYVGGIFNYDVVFRKYKKCL